MPIASVVSDNLKEEKKTMRKTGMTNVRPKNLALVVLFLTSYVPLFVLLILRQIKQNREFLYFGGFSIDNFLTAFQKFGLSFFLVWLILFGLIGLKILLGNFEKKVDNGTIVKIKKIENKNSESIAYIYLLTLFHLYFKTQTISLI